MRSLTDNFFGVWKRQWRKIVLALTSFLVLVAGLFVIIPDAHAIEAVMMDGNLTFNGRSFSGPNVTNSDSIIPAGSNYFLEDVSDTAVLRMIIWSPDEIRAGGEATLSTWEFAAPNTYVREVSSVTIRVVDGTARMNEDARCTAQVGAIGWIVCPTLSFLARATDYMFGVLEQFLYVEPLLADDNSPIFLTWQHMRNFANIVFVIFILVVILSQVTSVGISNYGIKKVLPRVITAAVLVNLSFVISAVAVDLSNVLGMQIRGLFVGIQESVAASAGGTNLAVMPSMVEVLTFVTGGMVATMAGLVMAGGVAGAVFLLIPVLFGAMVAVVAAFVTLAARQALIILLVIVSPLAFVAYLLPNTEKWFTKWKDLFMKMLILFPAFALVFGAASLAGWAIVTSATNITMLILGIAVQMIPLIFVPILGKLSGSMLGSLNSMVRRPFAPATKAVTNWSGEKRDIQRRRLAAGQGMFGRESRWNRAMPHAWAAGMAERGKARRANKLEQADASAKAIAERRMNESMRTKKGGVSRLGELNLNAGEKKYAAEVAGARWKNDMGSMGSLLDDSGNEFSSRQRSRLTKRGERMGNTFTLEQLEKARRVNIDTADTTDANKTISGIVAAGAGGHDMYRDVVRAAAPLGAERGLKSLQAQLATAQDREDKRMIEEATTRIGKSTQSTPEALEKVLGEALKKGDTHEARAAMSLYVTKNGSYGVSELEKFMRKKVFNPTEGEFQEVRDNNTTMGILSNYISTGDISNDLRKKAGLLWYWGAQNRGKNEDGTYKDLKNVYADIGSVPAGMESFFAAEGPSGAQGYVNNVLTGAGDIIAQSGGTLKQLTNTGGLTGRSFITQTQARQALVEGGVDPTLVDNAPDKLFYLGKVAGLFSGTQFENRAWDGDLELTANKSDKDAMLKIVNDFMNRFKPGSGMGI
ncbi:hypothetical protein FWD07_03245 [Candidatus Saccharibacteria bacterium]|nr:hypothetical protein [Candidatus Saccharibacteria bacterium]